MTRLIGRTRTHHVLGVGGREVGPLDAPGEAVDTMSALIYAKVKDLLSRVGDRLTPVCPTCGAEVGSLHFIECSERLPSGIVSKCIPYGAPGAGSDAYVNDVARLVRELRALVDVPIPALPSRRRTDPK